MTTTQIPRPATDKQLSFIRSLLNDLGRGDKTIPAGVTAAQASAKIEALIAEKKALTVAATPAAEVPLGMHQTADGDIYKVVKSRGSDRRYAKKLVIIKRGGYDFHTGETFGAARFDYDGGAIRKLSADTVMSIEQAAAFGQHWSICCNCATPLEDPLSVVRGIGPVCEGKFAGAQKRTAAARREAEAILAERCAHAAEVADRPAWADVCVVNEFFDGEPEVEANFRARWESGEFDGAEWAGIARQYGMAC